MKHNVLILITSVLCLVNLSVHGQDWENDAQMEAVEIEIVKEREIELPKANRNFDKIAPRATDPIKPPITYDFKSFSFQAPQVTPQIKPLKLKAESPSNIYGGFVRVGYGNYGSPLLEGYLNTRRDRNKLLGAYFHHSSSAKGPVDGKNSGSGNTALSLFGKSFSDHVALSGNFDFENRSTHFYGYPEGIPVDRDTLRQSFNSIKLSGELTNSKNSNFAYTLGAGFNYLADKFSAKETTVDLLFKTAYKIDDDSRINLQADYSIISRKDSEVEATPRNLFIIKPSYQFMPIEDLSLSIGLVVAYENDSIDVKNFHLYPDFKATYPISPSVDFVANLNGAMEKVSLQSLSQENLWLAPNVPIFHTNKMLELGAGINARLGNKVGVNTGIALATLQNWYFFKNSEENQAKFDVVYDQGSTKRSNIFAALSYAQSEQAKFLIRGDLFNYSEEDISEAWHRPTYKLTANGSYNLYKKLIFSADVIVQGGMKAFDPATDETVTLDGAFDLNFKTEYIFSPGLSAFIQLNNITSNKYPLFLHYPVRGFQFMAGVTWSF